MGMRITSPMVVDSTWLEHISNLTHAEMKMMYICDEFELFNT